MKCFLFSAPSNASVRMVLLCTCASGMLGVAAFAALAQPAPAHDAELAQAVRNHRYTEAAAQARALLQADPQQAHTWFYLGLAENGLGLTTRSLDDLQHALLIDPTMLQAAEAGAEIAYRGRDPRATILLDDVLKLDPANTTAHAMLGVLLLEEPNCAAALDHFAQAGSLAASDASTTRRLGVCRATINAEHGDFVAAERELSTLHQSSPADVRVSMALSSVLLQQRRAADAVKILAPIGSSLPPSGLALLAESQAETGDVSAAVTSYRESIARAPREENGYIDLAILSMEHQSPDVAMSVLNAALRVNPDSARLLVARGTVFAQLGKDDLAQQDFERADRLAPNSTYGTLGMGVLLREGGNLDEAEEVLEAKLKGDPKNPLLSFMLADVLVRKGASPGEPEFSRAEQLLHTALASDVNLAPAHALLGKILLKDNQPLPAVAELELAIKLQPTDRTALNQLVAAYRRLGRTADAARVSAVLETGVANERAQENDKNRIHLSLAQPEPGVPPPGASQPSGVDAQPQSGNGAPPP